MFNAFKKIQPSFILKTHALYFTIESIKNKLAYNLVLTPKLLIRDQDPFQSNAVPFPSNPHFPMTRQRNPVSPVVEESLEGTYPLDVAVSWLQCGRGLNTKFSTVWFQRAIPAAKEIYLKDFPACYPTSEHENHLDKALHAF